MSLEINVKLPRRDFELTADCRISDGITGMYGPSGAGKTSLLHLITGLNKPNTGRILFNGMTMVDTAKRVFIPPEKRGIGVVFQDSRLFPHLSVRKNLLFGMKGIPKEKRRITLEQTVELMKLEPMLDASPSDLSGGEKQRVAIGRALLLSPSLLLLDEPFSAVDTALRFQILPVLRRIHQELSIPMIIVSHELPDILKLTQDLIILKSGKIIGSGNFFDLIQHEDIFMVMQGAGVVNSLSLIIEKNDKTVGATMQHPDLASLVVHSPYLKQRQPGERVSLNLCPNAISLAKQPVDGISIENQLPATVIKVISNGSQKLCLLDMGVRMLATITEQDVGKLELTPGRKLHCLFRARAVQPFI